MNARDASRLLFDASPQPMWVVDLETRRFLDVNRAALERYGYARSEMLGLTLDVVSRTETLPRDLAATRVHGHVRMLPARHRTRHGTMLDVEITAQAIEVDDRPALLAVIVDVTERRRMEAALRESEQRYRRIVDNAAEGIWTYDADATITFANPRMAEMLGTTTTELVGSSLLDYVPADDLALALERVARRTRGESERSEARLRRKDGAEIVVRTHAVSLRDAAGAFEGGLVLMSDVTELKRTEEHLRQVAKMEAVGALAGGIAHDFNNLLSVILSYAGLLAEEPLDAPVREAIEEIRRAGERAATLTRQLLAFSRKQVLNPIVVDMNEVVADLRSLLLRLLGERIELALVASDAPAKVHVDRGQLEQVLVNLAVNARDAMPDGGRLTIETSTMPCPVESDAASVAYVRVAVTDTGVGMDEATQRRIFEPFFTTKEKGKGTGLGLATVYGIIRQSGGHVRVKTALGKGTCFEVFLPQTERVLDTEPTTSDVGASLRGTETILLVEDDAQVRSATAAVLRKSGYDVVEAENAGEALLVCEEAMARVDLLLTDVVMPRMSGPQLAERLRKLRPEIPVVYISGYADSALTRACGADVLAKPVAPSVLLRKIRSSLKG